MTDSQTGPSGATSDRQNASPSDVGDAERESLAPFPTLMTEGAPQWKDPMRNLFNAIRYVVRYVVRGGIPWRMMPKDFPPRSVVYQQARRWQRARVFEPIAHELRLLERGPAGPPGRAGGGRS